MPRLRFLRPSTGLGLEKRGIHPPIWPFIGRFLYLCLFAWLLPALISASLRKAGREGLKEIRRQVVRLKKMGKTGKEIEELTGVRQNRASEIWTAYQREGENSLERKKYGRKPGSHMVLTAEEQENIRRAIEEKIPEDFGITGKLWTLGRTRQYIQKQFHKAINERTLSDYMKRWGMSCQRPAKRARKQNPTGI